MRECSQIFPSFHPVIPPDLLLRAELARSHSPGGLTHSHRRTRTLAQTHGGNITFLLFLSTLLKQTPATFRPLPEYWCDSRTAETPAPCASEARRVIGASTGCDRVTSAVSGCVFKQQRPLFWKPGSFWSQHETSGTIQAPSDYFGTSACVCLCVFCACVCLCVCVMSRLM